MITINDLRKFCDELITEPEKITPTLLANKPVESVVIEDFLKSLVSD